MKFEERIERVLTQLKISLKAVRQLTGDASARRFFRVALPRDDDRRTAVLIVFPYGTEEVEVDRYIRMAEELRRAVLPVPEIYRVDSREGFIIVEDCGDELLQDVIAHRDPLPLYRQAVDLIVEMQERVSPDTALLNPPFDREKFLRELNFFLVHTLEGYYGADISSTDRDTFLNIFFTISREALNQTRVFCHRDYHSRNLLVQGDRLRIIDFQDGRIGPYTYDLVSLLEDPYADLKPDIRDELKEYFISLQPRDQKNNFFDDFYRDYDMMLIQRLLKAAGTFGYMFQEKDKPEYLKYLPAVFRRVDAVLGKHKEFQELRILINLESKK